MSGNNNDNNNNNKNSNNNNNNNKNKNNKNPDFRYHSENKIYSLNGRKKDYFGYSIGLYESTLVVGAYSASPVVQYSGSISIFTKNFTSSAKNKTVWSERATLVAEEALSHDSFGGSVSIWNKYILVGAHLDDGAGTSSGAAYIFENDGGTWKEAQRLVAPDSTAGNFFGFSSSICRDVAAVGAHGWAYQGSLVGAAYIFRLSSSSGYWSAEAKLTPSDVQEFQMFAYSVSTASNVILVGAYGDRAFGTNTGSAYIFTSETVTDSSSGNYTTYTKWTQTVKLRASNPQAHSYFGISTAMYYDPNNPNLCIAVVGASMATGKVVSSGAVYVFHGVIGNSGGYSWTQKAKLVAYDGASNDFFGAAVGVYGNVVLVGAKEDSVKATASGAAYLFSMSSKTEWSFQSKIFANDSGPYDDFGVSVALWEDVAVVGADRASGVVDESGCAYVYSPGLIKPLFPVNNRLMSMSQTKFILLLTVLPLTLLVLPMLLFAIFCQSKKPKPLTGGKLGGEDDDLSPASSHSSMSDMSLTSISRRPSPSTICSSHGLVSQTPRSIHERIEGRSTHKGLLMTSSGGAITPMIAEQLRHSSVISKQVNPDLFS